ncbi:MAG: DMT family transporter [Rhodobiaceae bacterium]|nr:DMT family transporter [Rhodobiaceae bacterium]
MTLKRSPGDWLLLAALVAVWGSSFGLSRVAVVSISPIWVVALRLSLGAVILCALALARGQKLPREARAWGWFAWLATTGNVLPFFLITWGTVHIDSGLAGILIGSVPIVVILLGHFLLPDEPMNRFKTIGVATGFAGVIVLIGPRALTELSGSGVTLLAEIAVLIAAFSYATQAVTARRMPPMGVVTRAASVLLLSAVAALILAATLAPHGLADATASGLVATVALGLFPTAAGTLILFRLLDRAGAGFVANSNYLIPAWALLAGMLFLGEKLAWNTALGFALILAGIAVGEHLGARSRARQSRLAARQENGMENRVL